MTSTKMISGILFIFLFFGLYLVATGIFPVVDNNVDKAIKSRGKRKINSVQQTIDFFTPKLIKYINIDYNKRLSLKQNIDILYMETTPELLYAKAIVMGGVGFFNTFLIGIFFIMMLFVLGFEVALSMLFLLLIVVGIVSAVGSYRKVFKDIDKQLEDKKIAIEYELPQFTGTIYQQLNQNSNVQVIDILQSYRKISGKYLRQEIDRTINEMDSAISIQQSLENLARRVNSPSVNQITQGLISLSRGDNQYQYFQMLTSTFETKHKELIKQELLKRPKQLTPYNALMLAGIVAMLVIAVGSHLMDSATTFM